MENPRAHERTTGPELWDQTEGRITHFVASVGTGGTISRRRPACSRPGTRPSRSSGRTPRARVLSGDIARPYLTEGVGEDFFPGTYDASVIDRWVRVSDRDAFAMARRITREEGILAGGSCGTALVAAREVVRDLIATDGGHDAVIVVLLPDSGRSYLSKLYNDEWMRANGLMATTGAATRIDDAARRPPPRRRSADGRPRAHDRARRRRHRHAPGATASARCRSPRTPRATTSSGIVGSISEKGLLDRAYRDPSVVERTVGEVMDRPLPAGRGVGHPRRGLRAAVAAARPRSSRSVASARPAS